ncbi:MAG TPA: polymer-forming cytoskeletal protein [Pyrinomonadaceae bacterium]|jgi:cytoskeletal protein CcmA (bactofilin family)|nr:polymer-forming cytoskeletal protein [Pyrinomonadaceae bacterium]
MFRPGKNPKDSTHTTDDTADHTPQSTPSSYASSTPSAQQQTPTEAYQQSVHTQTTSRAVTESESLARDIKEGTLTGFVGNGTTLTGEASFKGMLRVDGALSGRVSSADGTLIVSTNGRVDANVEVAVAQIYGTVNGDITASKRIEMGRVAKVTGNIQTPALIIENGALFEGGCRMMQVKEQQSEKQGGDRKAETPSTSSSTSSSSSGALTPSASGSSTSSSSGSASSAPAAKSANASSPSDAKGSTGAAG